MRLRHLARCGLALLSTIIIANCSSGDGTGTEGSIDFTLNPTSASVVQGGSTITNGTLTRSGGFTGVVNFTVTGQPGGLTASASNIVTTGSTTTATFTLDVGASVPTGTYSIVVHANGTGVTEVNKTFTLTVTAAGSFTLAVTPTGAISMAQGATDNSKTIMIARTTYAANITLAAEGLPSGVTATFAPNPAGANSSLMTLNATAGATVGGPTIVTVRGTGPAAIVAPGTPASVEATTTFSLTITVAVPAGNFTLTTTPTPSVSVTQGVNGTATININRTGGNTSSITLSSTSTLPAGMSLAFAPNPTTANSSTLTIGTTAATPTGATTPIVIRGNTPGLGEQLVSLNILVNAPSGSGNVNVSWSGCAADQKPVWVAAQNGTGAWTVLTGVNDVYNFNVNAGKGGLTYVLTGSGGSSQVIVQYMSQAEWTAGTISFCSTTTPSGRTLTGTVAGIGAGDIASVSFGGTTVSVLGLSPSFVMNNAGLGTRDLVIYSHALSIGISDRMLIDRGQNPASSFGTRNMQSDPFSFTPNPALITITGALGGETFTHSNTFYSRSTCDPAPLYFGTVSGTQFTAYGAQTVLTGERHAIFITGTLGTTASRSVIEFVGALTSHSVALGSLLPLESVTETGTNYSILRNQYTAPADLNTSYTFSYTQNSAPKTAIVTATAAYFGGSAIDERIGEYTGLTGWLASWAPAKGQAASLTTSASGATGTGGICTGATRFIVATRTATF